LQEVLFKILIYYDYTCDFNIYQSNEEVEKLKKEIEGLRQHIAELKHFLHDKEIILEEYIKKILLYSKM